MKICIIVVNWNGQSYMMDCLESLEKQSYSQFQTIVVDNGSTDGSVAAMKRYFPHVKIIQNQENLGFAKANNIAIKRAMQDGAEAIALLNNDCAVDVHWLAELANTLRRDESIGACASQLLFKKNKNIINSLGVVIDSFGFAKDGHFNENYKPQRVSEETLGFCAGACLIRSEVLKTVGLFDEFYFMYFEDVDLSLRILKQGYKIVTVPTAIVFHEYSGSSKRIPHTKHYLAIRNHLYLVSKFFSIKKLPFILMCTLGLRVLQGIFILFLLQFKLLFWHYCGLFSGIYHFFRVFYHKQYKLDKKLEVRIQKFKLADIMNWKFLKERFQHYQILKKYV